MKIIVLHGDDTQKSYARLVKFKDEAKRRGWEIINDQFPVTPSLFGVSRIIIYRNYLLITLKDIKNFSRFDGNLVIYNEGLIPQNFIKLLPKDTKIEEFKLPKLIWNFLEHFYPGNSMRVIKEFHQVIQRDPPEFVFSLIARQARDLYWAKTEPLSIPYPLWRTSKLKAQSSKFSESELASFIGLLSKIDIEVKTGKADLVSSLDLLIIKQLE